jgi:hypothetical protein
MSCDLLTYQTASVDDPPHDFTEDLPRTLVANQLVKVPQVFRK